MIIWAARCGRTTEASAQLDTMALRRQRPTPGQLVWQLLVLAGITALIAAFGFFSNRWTLANIKSSGSKTADQKPGKTQRILAVSLTLVFSAVAATGAVFAMIGY